MHQKSLDEPLPVKSAIFFPFSCGMERLAGVVPGYE